MKSHMHRLTVVPLMIAALFLSAFSPPMWAGDGSENKTSVAEVVELKDARIKFEVNATDGDGGIQVFIDAEAWKSMSIIDPKGRVVFRSTASGSIGKQGVTELFFESAEPEFSELSLEELLNRFPEADYQFKGKGLEGEQYVGTASLTHYIPDGPKLVFPIEGDGPQDPNNTVVMWEAVGPANGSPIIGYQVLVVQTDSSFAAIPKVALDIIMPATATSMVVPPGFLLADTEYEWEVLAIEASGNQTLSSSFLQTAP